MLPPIAKFRAFLDALMGKKGPIKQEVGFGRRILLLLQGKMATRQAVLHTMVEGGQSAKTEKVIKEVLAQQAQKVSLTRSLSGQHKEDSGIKKEKEAEKFQFIEESSKDIDAASQKEKFIAQGQLSVILKQKGEEHELGVPIFPMKGSSISEVGKREGLFGTNEEGEEGGGGAGLGIGLPSWFKTPPLELKKYIWHWLIRAIILLAAIILALVILL